MQYRLLVVFGFAAVVLAGSLVAAAPQPAAASHRAGIVVQFGDGHVATACIAFAGPSISGFDLLQQSGLQIVAQTDGGNALVCKIDQQGCTFPNQACLCQCAGGTACRYWAYWHLNAGHWQFSTLGASSTEVQSGGVDGWAWGGGSVASGSQPPLISFDQICSAPALPTTVPPTRSLPSVTTVRTKQPPPLVPTRPVILPTANTSPPVLVPTRPLLLPTANTLPSATENRPPALTLIAPTATIAVATMPPSTSSATTPSATPISVVNNTTLPTARPVESPITLATTPPAAGEVIQPASGTLASSGWDSYLVFGILFIGLLLAIILVRRRQA
ncbi:MAG: hypothetical protein H0X37_17880 [Herpetosiphonaceae bacterium]|nr:hypothetical protein [Herpetosiphonaceae bacterium]